MRMIGALAQRHADAMALSRRQGTASEEVVMTTAWGYNERIYEVFLSSLRRTGYSGDVCIVAPPHHTRPAALAVVQAHRATIVPELNLTIFQRPSVERFLHFAAICAGGGYRRCLSTDFRDVFFQSDPFAQARTMGASMPDLIAPQERRILTESSNAYMLRKCAGPPVANELRNQSVLCSGVLLGSAEGFAFLAHSLVPISYRCPFDKMSDQASLNWLLQQRPMFEQMRQAWVEGARQWRRAAILSRHRAANQSRLLTVRMEPAGSGFTSTIGNFKDTWRQIHALMRDGVLLNDDGTPAPVVHQYERPLLGSTKELLTQPSGNRKVGVRFRALEEALGWMPRWTTSPPADSLTAANFTWLVGGQGNHVKQV